MKRQLTLEEYAESKEKKKRLVRKAGAISFFLGPYGICFLMFFVFPFVFGIIISFCEFDGKSLFPSEFVGFENYIKIFTNRVLIKDFWSSVWYTFRFAMIIVPLCMVIPLGLALIINIKPPMY